MQNTCILVPRLMDHIGVSVHCYTSVYAVTSPCAARPGRPRVIGSAATRRRGCGSGRIYIRAEPFASRQRTMSHPTLDWSYYTTCLMHMMYHTPRWRRQFACELLPNRITSRLLAQSDKLLDSCSRLLLTDAILMLIFVVVVVKNKFVSIMCFIAHYRIVNEHTILENRDVNNTCKKQWCLWESTGFLEAKEE